MDGQTQFLAWEVRVFTVALAGLVVLLARELRREQQDRRDRAARTRRAILAARTRDPGPGLLGAVPAQRDGATVATRTCAYCDTPTPAPRDAYCSWACRNLDQGDD